jgi:hypothetical protein
MKKYYESSMNLYRWRSPQQTSQCLVGLVSSSTNSSSNSNSIKVITVIIVLPIDKLSSWEHH